MFSRCLPLILLVLIALPEARAEEPASERLGTLRIVSKYWADVYVDGKRRGRAPLPPLSLPVGIHVVSLRSNPALGQYRREVIIRAGEVTELFVDPEGADEASPVEPGERGPPRSRAASTGMSEERGTGTLQLVTSYWSDVYVNGNRVGRAPMPPIALPAGTHRVTLLGNPGVKIYRREVIIRARQRTELRVDPDSPLDALPVESGGTGASRSRAASAGRSREVGQGHLQLVTKHWANVYVDDEFKGRAPLASIPLPAGKHVIVLRGNPSVAPYRQEVVIHAGETTELRIELKLVE